MIDLKTAIFREREPELKKLMLLPPEAFSRLMAYANGLLDGYYKLEDSRQPAQNG